MIREILLLGNPKLYETSAPILRQEVESLRPVVADLHDTLVAYRRQYGAGRAIAAPQIGVQKRLLYLYIDHPVAFLNPELAFPNRAQMAVLDDCMSFPDCWCGCTDIAGASSPIGIWIGRFKKWSWRAI